MIEIFGFLGGAIGVGAGIPQFIKLLKLSHFEGLSKASWMLFLSGSIAWATFGLRVHSISALICNTLAGIINFCIVLMLLSKYAKVFLPVYVLLIFLIIFFLPSFIVTIILLGFTCAQLPQLRVSFQNYRKNLSSAVSLGNIYSTIASYSCWVIYGFGNHLMTIWLTSILGLMQSLSILFLQLPSLRSRFA